MSGEGGQIGIKVFLNSSLKKATPHFQRGGLKAISYWKLFNCENNLFWTSSHILEEGWSQLPFATDKRADSRAFKKIDQPILLL